MQKPNSVNVLLQFFLKQILKKDTTLSVRKSLRTLHGQGLRN